MKSTFSTTSAILTGVIIVLFINQWVNRGEMFKELSDIKWKLWTQKLDTGRAMQLLSRPYWYLTDMPNRVSSEPNDKGTVVFVGAWTENPEDWAKAPAAFGTKIVFTPADGTGTTETVCGGLVSFEIIKK